LQVFCAKFVQHCRQMLLMLAASNFKMLENNS